MGELLEIPVHKRNKSVQEVLTECGRLDMTQCLVIGWSKQGNLVARVAKNLSSADALWLLKAAEMDVMGRKPTMFGEESGE